MEKAISKIFYLNKRVVFPYCTINILFAITKTAREIELGDRIIAYPIRNMLDMIFYRNKLGTLSEVIEVEQHEKSVSIQLKGIERVKIKKIDKFQDSRFEMVTEEQPESLDDLKEELKKKTQELIFLINVEESDKLIYLLNYFINMKQITDFIAHYFVLDFSRRYRLFNELNIEKRTLSLLSIIDVLIRDINKKRGAAVL